MHKLQQIVLEAKMHADSCKSLSIIYDIFSSSMPVHITSRYANMIQKAEEMSIKLYNSSHIYLPISILMIKTAQAADGNYVIDMYRSTT